MGTMHVNWTSWNDAAFSQAEAEQKPVLLSISALWCHWCHVMDDECYADQQIADYINTNFIPIRVDSDKRPDLNRRYNMGGWPSTVFLNNKGEIITGATYLPAKSMLALLESVKDNYHTENNEQGRLLVGAGFEGTFALTEPRDLEGREIYRYLEEEIEKSYDPENGGFGTAPKFPHTQVLRYALEQASRDGEPLPSKVSFTLKKMAEGGIYDKKEGGFFRYSTTRDWLIPHYEKMASDNAELLQLYLWCYLWSGEEFYREIAQGIIGFIEGKLRDGGGGFYGSQDAVEEYYQSESREGLPEPTVDKTIYTDWSSQLARSYLLAAEALEMPALGDFALKTVERLIAEGQHPTGGVAHHLGDEAIGGQLIDQVELALAAFSCYQYSGRDFFLSEGKKLVDLCLQKAWDRENGGFWDQFQTGNVGILAHRVKVLGANALAAQALFQVWALQGEPFYHEYGMKTLAAWGGAYTSYGLFAAELALAALRSGAPLEVRITGFGERSRALAQAVFSHYHPWQVVLWEEGDEAQLQLCYPDRCLPPTSSPEEVRRLLRGGELVV